MTPKHLSTIAVWVLALIIPGGFALLALWLSYRAAKKRGASLASARLSLVPAARPSLIPAGHNSVVAVPASF